MQAPASTDRPIAVSRYLSGGGLALLVTLAVGAVLAFIYYQASTVPVRAICDGQVMRPGDTCIGRNSFGYEQGMATARWNHDHATASIPIALGVVAIWFLLLVWRILSRRKPPEETPGATWHGAPVLANAVTTGFGLGLVALGLFLLVGPRNEDSLHAMIPIGISMLGAFFLFTALPAGRQLVRVDDTGVLAIRGRTLTQVPWGNVTAVDVAPKGNLTAWKIRHRGGSLVVGPSLSAPAELGRRLLESRSGRLPQDRQQVNAGQPQQFGAATITPESLVVGKDRFAWRDIATLSIDDHNVVIGGAGGQPLTTIARKALVDLPRFQAIAEALVKANRPQQ